MTTIRTMVEKDLPAAYELVEELAIYEKEPDAVTATLEDYKALFAQAKFQGLVAVQNDQVVGIMIFYDTFSTWKGKMLYLEDFVVRERFRGQGIGQLLYDAFEAYARSNSYVLVKWQVLDWNTPAVKFYQKNQATIEKEWWNVKKYL